jgi:hypothetical protein
MKDPKKKFTYVEIAFFSLWFDEQDQDTQENVKKLVQEGRLTFVNGGWSMSDEANVHYEDFINNMKAGHDWLRQNLEFRPSIGWHIDPFGHQSATAALFSEMGFDAWFFARADYQDKAKRLEDKSLEFLWRPLYNNLGNRTEIYTQLLYQHYHAPEGFCFNERCTDEPIIDDPELETYNVDNRTAELYNYLTHMAKHFRTNHLLVPFGQDFAYLNAQKSFKNLDKLIKHMNAKYPDMNLFYSTPYEYIDAIHASEVELPTKYDDMLPYADQPHAYWTGYYTSRANFKNFVRETSGLLNAASLFYAMEGVNKANATQAQKNFKVYEKLMREMGVSQHHDAVAGTAKQAVMDNYALRLDKTGSKFRSTFADILADYYNAGEGNIAVCKSVNSTYHDCPTKLFEEGAERMRLLIFNQMPQRSEISRMPLPSGNFTGFSLLGSPMDFICFHDGDCAAFGSANLEQGHIDEFMLTKDDKDNSLPESSPTTTVNYPSLNVTFVQINEEGQAEFEIMHKKTKSQDKISIDLSYYTAFDDISEPVSGAYLFRTANKEEKPSKFNTISKVNLFIGTAVSAYELIGDEATITVFVNTNDDYLTVETSLKGLPLTKKGMELVLRIQSDSIQNQGIFYTDSMGMELQQRVLNHRDSWDLDVNEPISGNFYPVNSAIVIRDCKRELQVLPDRAQGGSSLSDGLVELLVQRRLYVDDSRGLEEALNETDPHSADGRGPSLITRHMVRARGVSEDQEIRDTVQYGMTRMTSPWMEFYYLKDSSFLDLEQHNSLKSIINTDSLKFVIFPESQDTIFARFENILDTYSLSETATFDLEVFVQNAFFRKVKSITEVSLSGLYTMEDMNQRLKWKGEDFTSDPVDYGKVDLNNVEIMPQQIRSFRIQFDLEEDPEQAKEMTS